MTPVSWLFPPAFPGRRPDHRGVPGDEDTGLLHHPQGRSRQLAHMSALHFNLHLGRLADVFIQSDLQ